jgi:hypothetical protein
MDKKIHKWIGIALHIVLIVSQRHPAAYALVSRVVPRDALWISAKGNIPPINILGYTVEYAQLEKAAAVLLKLQIPTSPTGSRPIDKHLTMKVDETLSYLRNVIITLVLLRFRVSSGFGGGLKLNITTKIVKQNIVSQLQPNNIETIRMSDVRKNRKAVVLRQNQNQSQNQ